MNIRKYKRFLATVLAFIIAFTVTQLPVCAFGFEGEMANVSVLDAEAEPPAEASPNPLWIILSIVTIVVAAAVTIVLVLYVLLKKKKPLNNSKKK